MASNATRVRQRGQAVNRLIEAAKAAAESAGVEAVAIPTHHREPDYLQTLQIEAAADLLERIIGAASGVPEAIAALKEQHFAEFTEAYNADPVVIDLEAAYAAYDSDERVNGPDDFEAFCDAVNGALNVPEGTVEGIEDDGTDADAESGEEADADAAPAESSDTEQADETTEQKPAEATPSDPPADKPARRAEKPAKASKG